MKRNLEELLKGNPYPGRGIVIGTSGDGKRSIVMYFIMGRSENSRNRIFEKTDDGIRTAAFDESKVTDPSLIIYRPVRVVGGITIVSNGDQTDTIWNYLTKGATYHAALETREFEPDAPNYTPRISAIVQSGGAYTMSILKTAEGDSAHCLRFFFEYPKSMAGLGHMLTTYETDGDPLPSFCGEPIAIDMSGTDDFAAFTDKIWDVLNVDNKVSLYACARDIAIGEVEEIIKNKHNGD